MTYVLSRFVTSLTRRYHDIQLTLTVLSYVPMATVNTISFQSVLIVGQVQM